MIDKYHVFAEGEEKDPAKDLVENRYSFEYRKKYALYLKKFAFYDHSLEIVVQILKEEITYYNLQTIQLAEGEESKKDAIPEIIIEEMSVFAGEDRYTLKPDTNPYYQVRLTYYQLAKVYTYKLQVPQVVQALEIAKKITVES